MPKPSEPLLTLSYGQLERDLRFLSAGDGEEHVYHAPPEAGCQYFDKDGLPGCIIGHVFALHSVSREDLELFRRPDTPLSYEEDTLPTWPNESNVSTLVRCGALTFTDAAAKDLAVSAQSQQDQGVAWGEAVSHAILRATPKPTPEDPT